MGEADVTRLQTWYTEKDTTSLTAIQIYKNGKKEGGRTRTMQVPKRGGQWRLALIEWRESKFKDKTNKQGSRPEKACKENTSKTPVMLRHRGTFSSLFLLCHQYRCREPICLPPLSCFDTSDPRYSERRWPFDQVKLEKHGPPPTCMPAPRGTSTWREREFTTLLFRMFRL